ncbi:MAG: aldehyde dehydrogenase family protein [Bradyrhizobium sp.]
MNESTGVLPRTLALPAPRDFAALIDGHLVPAAEREAIERRSPAHGAVVSRYPTATVADVRTAITAARREADHGTWRRMSGAARAQIIARVAQLIDGQKEELGLIELLETGKPISGVVREIGGSVGLWDFAASLARRSDGDLYDQLGGDSLGLVFREPVGVVGMITPWNYPLLIVSQKLPFALAVGCCAVVKPSELTSGTTLRLGELLVEAGVPPGVVSIVAGDGPAAGRPLCESAETDMISFTGSTRVGREIGALCGRMPKRVSLELGGKSAQIVCADADLERAAERVAFGVTRNAGQACVSGSRLLVEDAVADRFIADVTERLHRVRVGDPLDPDTEMGPLVSEAQRSRVQSYVNAGIADGATFSGRADTDLPAQGFFIHPGVFTGVRPAMSIAQEEIFGPILSVMRFGTIEEAVTLANGTAYGLSAGLWTRDMDKVFAIGRALRAGTVEINTYMAGAPELPLTGYKQSGLGHDKGCYAVEEFTNLKTLLIQLKPGRG